MNPKTPVDIDNIFTVPDESFEADLDENFYQAFNVIKQIKKHLKTIYTPPTEEEKIKEAEDKKIKEAEDKKKKEEEEKRKEDTPKLADKKKGKEKEPKDEKAST